MTQGAVSLRGKRVLLAENEPGQRQRLALTLERAGFVVDLCCNGVELQEILQRTARTLDVVVTDLHDMGEEGVPFIPDRDLPLIIQAYAPLPFIIYSAASYLAQHYESAGVRGYVLKSDTPQELLAALRAVLVNNKDMYYSSGVELTYRLSRRELQVLRLAAEGLTTKEIAGRLVVAEATIEKYRQRIFLKISLPDEDSDHMNMTRAVAIAVREKLIRP